jgi:pimeloyl-ACP methyl ester carboxylesterase
MTYTEHRYDSHDGLSLYYRDYGPGGDALICLPGMSRNSKDFEDLAEHLSARWRVISPDFRGRGQSAWDPKPANYQAMSYARDTWTLLDGLGIHQFVVIGTSLGGLVAMVMASQQAERLRAVVMNDIAPEIPPDAAARILKYVGRTPPVADWEAAAVQARQIYGQALPGLPDEFWLSWVRCSYREDESGKPVPDMDPAVGDALRKAASAGFDSWNLFSALTMPCLLLRGALSDVLTQETADRMQAIKPDIELVTVPDRGHAPLLNEGSSRKAIDTFLDRQPA